MKLRTGGKGKMFNDRELAAEVRTLTLQEIKKALQDKTDEEFKKAVILRLAGSILPRLVGGDPDNPLIVPLILPAQLIDKNDTNQDAKPSRHG